MRAGRKSIWVSLPHSYLWGADVKLHYQLRRFTADPRASYFDWLGSSHYSLILTLQKNFTGCFNRTQLQITPDGMSVINRDTRLTYRHCFSRNKLTGLINPEALDDEFEAVQAKLERQAIRWLRRIRSEKILFVRHALTTIGEACELFEALSVQANGNAFELLMITPPNSDITSVHPQIHIVPGIPLPHDPAKWQGDDALWDEVLGAFAERST